MTDKPKNEVSGPEPDSGDAFIGPRLEGAARELDADPLEGGVELAKNEDLGSDEGSASETLGLSEGPETGSGASRRPGLISRLFRRKSPSDVASEPPPEAGADEFDESGPEPDDREDLDRESVVEEEERVLPPRKRGFRLPGLRKKAVSAPEVDVMTEAPVIFEGPTDDAAADASGAVAPPPPPKRAGQRPKRGFPPIQVIIGWIEESAPSDVLAHARGFAEDHIEAVDNAWVAMSGFRGGTLFEIHEGGDGRAYLPDLIEELSRDPEQVLWVPSGTKLNRAVTVSLVEGRPFSMMLNEKDSARVRESGRAPVERTGRMRRLSPRGTSVLVIGFTLFAIATGVLTASTYLSASIDQQPLPALSYDSAALPHGQIVSLSTALREDRWVSRILFENGAWRAEFETFEDLVLPEDTGEAQRLIDEAVERNLLLDEERERKLEELMSE